MKNLCIRESYTNKNNEEKVSWNKVGTLFTGKNGKEYIKLFFLPGVLISVFEPRPKNEEEAGEDIF